MSHGGLSRAGGDTALAQVRPECVPHGVNIHRVSAIVALCDARGSQVAVKYSDQSGGHVEQWVINWQIDWHRFAGGPGFNSSLLDDLAPQTNGGETSEAAC